MELINQVARIFELQSFLTGKNIFEDERIIIRGIPEDFCIYLKFSAQESSLTPAWNELVCECVFDNFYTMKDGLWIKYLPIIINRLEKAVEDEMKKVQVQEIPLPTIDDSELFSDVFNEDGNEIYEEIQINLKA